MKVLINAISIHGGGAFVVLKQLLEAMSGTDPDIKWHVAAEPTILNRLPSLSTITKWPYSWANKSPIHLLYWYEIVLPKLLHQIKADICFSQTNYLPRRRLPCSSLLLVQHAGHFSEEFRRLLFQQKKKYLEAFAWSKKNKWVYGSIKRADKVTVQTNALAKKISDQLGIHHEKIAVIPHGAGLLEITTQKPRNFPINTVWRIGYITKFGIQKDFDTAFKAIRLLKNKGVSIKFILTLDHQNPDFQIIYDRIRQIGIEDVIENQGEITNADEIKKLYESLHIFIFPSVCESYGFPLVEAITAGLPTIIADTDSNKEVAGKAVETFQSGNEMQLANKIHSFIENENAYILASENCIERSKVFCWNKTARQILDVIYQLKG